MSKTWVTRYRFWAVFERSSIYSTPFLEIPDESTLAEKLCALNNCVRAQAGVIGNDLGRRILKAIPEMFSILSSPGGSNAPNRIVLEEEFPPILSFDTGERVA